MEVRRGYHIIMAKPGAKCPQLYKLNKLYKPNDYFRHRNYKKRGEKHRQLPEIYRELHKLHKPNELNKLNKLNKLNETKETRHGKRYSRA